MEVMMALRTQMLQRGQLPPGPAGPLGGFHLPPELNKQVEKEAAATR